MMGDMEKIENDIEPLKLVSDAGFMSMDHYNEHKSHVVSGLVNLGSPFDVALGLALDKADLRNSIKILRYWNHICEQYALFYTMHLAVKKKEENVAQDGVPILKI